MQGFASIMLAAGAVAQSPPPPSPPVIVTVPVAASPVQTSMQRLLLWQPAEVRCEDGAAPAIVTLRRPLNELSWSRTVLPVRYRFAIDAQGRTHSIRQDNSPRANGTDGAAALSASRFAPNAARTDCTIGYDPQLLDIAGAPKAELASFVIHTRPQSLSPAIRKRLFEGDGCQAEPRLQPLVQTFPDYAKLPSTPGNRDWTLVGFDVGADGKPRAVRTLVGNGNAALDKAGVAAVSASRFASGSARQGCSVPFHRFAGILEAPALKPLAERESGPCGRSEPWQVKPQLSYPTAYQRRAIEGWATLDYDVAPWGEIGNVRVVESQPTEDFGIAAKTMLERAKRPEGPSATGCRTRVRYEMRREGSAAAPEDAADNS